MKVKIEDVIFWIFFIAAIVLFVWYVFGGSPTLEVALIVFLISLAVRNHGSIKELKGRFNEFVRRFDEHLKQKS